MTSLQPVISIPGRNIGPGTPCFVIAEASSNHDRDLKKALAMIDSAADAGADAVKFQAFTADSMVGTRCQTPTQTTFGRYNSLRELYKNCEMPREWLPTLKQHATKRGILFLCTPFDTEAVEALEQIEIPLYKVASFELNHFDLLDAIAATGKPVILSTGFAFLGEIEEAVERLLKHGADKVALLHCGIEYPVAPENVHLRAIETIRRAFGCPTGYSDHTSGLEIALAAAALGADIIEKHFIMDGDDHAPDRAFSLPTGELATMVRGVRTVSACLGHPAKKPSAHELEISRSRRRSLFAARDIKSGETMDGQMIVTLRPGDGLHPRDKEVLLGAQAVRDIPMHTPLSWSDFLLGGPGGGGRR